MESKFIRKIASIFLGVTMAFGVGLAITSNKAKPVYATSPATLTFTAACGGSGTDSDGNSWTISSDAAESSYDGTKGIHYGTSKAAVSYLNLSTSDINGTITEIVVNASGASGTSAKLNVTVGGNEFDSEKSLTSSATTYNLTGSASGEIIVSISQASATKALYCKSIAVTYTNGGGGENPPEPTVEDTTLLLTASLDKTILDLNESVQLSATVKDSNQVNVENAEISFTSSNSSIATVSSDGLVSASASNYGSTIITASYAGDANYNSSEAQIIIRVSNPNAPVFNVKDIALINDWTSESAYDSLGTIGSVTISASGTGNNRKYYSSGNGTWRFYSSGNGAITISTSNGYLKKIILTTDGAQYFIDAPANWSYANKVFTSANKEQTSVTLSNGSGTSKIEQIEVQIGNAKSVSYNANGGTGTMNDFDSPYDTGSTVTVLENTFALPQGYIFDHWNTREDNSGDNYLPGETFTINENTILYAQWVETINTYYTVSFDSNGGNLSPVNQTVEEGSTFVFPNPGTKSHYSFDGWTSTGTAPYFAEGGVSPIVLADANYIAHWTEDAKYSVTYNSGENGSGSFIVNNIYVGSYELPEFEDLSTISPANGYRFKDYTIGGVNKNPGDTITLDASINVTVNFEERPLDDILTDTVIGTQDATYTSSWAQIDDISDYSGATYMIRTMKPAAGNGYTMQTNANGYMVTTSCPNGSKVKSISFSFLTNGKNLAIYGSNTAYIAGEAPSSNSVGTVNGNGGSVSFDFSALDKVYRYVAFKGTGSSTVIGTITVEWEPLTSSDLIKEIKTQSLLSYSDYTDNGNGTFSFTKLGIRFGGKVSVELYDSLSAEGYGIFFAPASSLGDHTIEFYYKEAKTNENTVAEAITAMCAAHGITNYSNTFTRHEPTLKSTPTKVGDDYSWKLHYSIADDDGALLAEYVAVAYILVDGDIIFLQEQSATAQGLANEMINITHEYKSDDFGGSLNYIATRE